MSKIDVQIVSKTDERSTPTVAVRRPKGTSTLGYCCRALFVVLAVWAAIVGAGIYQLVTVTTIEPHTIDVAPSARAPDRVIEISVDAHVKSFPAQFSIKLESARCAVGGGGGDESESESLSLSLDTEGLLVATDSAHFSPTATYSIESAKALRSHLAAWRASDARVAPSIDCRAAATLGVLGVPVRLPLTINLDVDVAAAAEEEEQQQQEGGRPPLV